MYDKALNTQRVRAFDTGFAVFNIFSLKCPLKTIRHLFCINELSVLQ